MTDDTMLPLQSRIAAIVGEEDRLNRARTKARGVKQARRDMEKRSEASRLSAVEAERNRQVKTNADTERKFQDALKREGVELVNLSKEIRDEYIAEVRHQKVARERLQSKITALEATLRGIDGARP